jgi:sulfur-oxidizing protein SoxY
VPVCTPLLGFKVATTINFKIMSRRTVLVSGASAAAFLASTSGWPALAADEDATRRSPAFELAYRTLLGEAEPAEDGTVHLELPEIPENGNTVPFKMWVDSPMTATDSIKTLHLLSTGNPQPRVAAFHFSPLSGKAAVSGRMRLARSQNVVALAERSDGKFVVSFRRVDVTIGGCGN